MEDKQCVCGGVYGGGGGGQQGTTNLLKVI